MSEAITPAVSDRICKHMNEDHADAVLLYAQVFGGATDATEARMISIDAEGMDLAITGDVMSRRVNFDHQLKDAEDAHHTLIEMVKQARMQAKA